MKNFILATSILLLGSLTLPGQDSYLSKRIIEEINNDYSSYESLYKYLHENPELSHQEKETSQLIKRKLQSFGYEITDSLGGYGFAGILHNGAGPVIMYRTDMDALPIKEQTGLPYASSKTAILEGDETAVMHACGHDMHMTVFTGTAESMLKLKDHWKGTLLLLAQPAEERGGAQILLKNDLFSRIPIPDIALAFHVAPDLETGKIGYCPGPAYASVGTIDMTVYGQGGHGAYPHMSIDPIVLSARIILAIQTIVSREISPIDAAVVTVGSIHAGTKHNIIPDEVTMKLTLRAYSDEVMDHLVTAIHRISEGIALSAGLAKDRYPMIVEVDERLPVLYNNLELTRKISTHLIQQMGEERIVRIKPVTGAEDFGRYGKTKENIPICIMKIGTVSPEKLKESREKGILLPSLHSPSFAPVPESTILTGIEAMTHTLIELFDNK